MRLDEVTIDTQTYVFETLRSEIAIDVKEMYEDLLHQTESFTVPVWESCSSFDREEYQKHLTSLRDAVRVFNPPLSQTLAMIVEMLKYYAGT